MLRTLRFANVLGFANVLAATALLVLTTASAQADTLATRIHEAAVKACAPEASASLPASHYAAITKACVYRISASATAKYLAEADAKTKASTAVVSTN